MPLISFFARRFLTGAIARRTAVFLERRFKMSPAMASLAFVVLTEVLARAAEKPSVAGAKKAGSRFGRRG